MIKFNQFCCVDQTNFAIFCMMYKTKSAAKVLFFFDICKFI